MSFIREIIEKKKETITVRFYCNLKSPLTHKYCSYMNIHRLKLLDWINMRWMQLGIGNWIYMRLKYWILVLAIYGTGSVGIVENACIWKGWVALLIYTGYPPQGISFWVLCPLRPVADYPHHFFADEEWKTKIFDIRGCWGFNCIW